MRGVAAQVPREQLHPNRGCLCEVTVIVFELILNGLLDPIARLLWMKVQEHLNALVFMPVIHVINDKPFHATGHLLQLPEEALLPSLCHRGDGGAGPRILLRDHVAILGPHVRDDLTDLRVIISVRETHHGQVLLSLTLRVLRRLLIQLFQLIQNQLHQAKCHLTLNDIGTVKAVEAVGAHDAPLLAEDPSGLTLFAVVAEVLDQLVLDLNN